MNHTELDLERTLAYHGAPAMAGIKSADLIAWGSPEACSTPLFRQYQHQLARRGIQLRVIWIGCPRCLLLVYRPERLERLEISRRRRTAFLAALAAYVGGAL